MKKVLSMFLVLAMMLSLVAVTTVASSAEQVTIGTELTSADQLAAKGEYYMTGDIDAGTDQITIADGVVLYGNGYTLKTSVSFAVTAGSQIVEFKNVVFNTTCTLIESVDGCNISFTDCTRTGDISSTTDKTAGYIGVLTGTGSKVTFTDCTNDGAVAGTTHRTAGFIGAIWDDGSSDVTFTRCTNAKAVTSDEGFQIGGFIGSALVAATVSFEDCINAGAVTGRKDVGGFIGLSQGDFTFIFKNCVNSGTVKTDLYEYVGGFLGETISGGAATFEDCTNSGEISSGKHNASGFIGKSSGITLIFKDCANSGAITTAGQSSAGFVGEIDGKTASFTNCTNSENVYSGVHYAAGLVAQVKNVTEITFQNCHNTGSVETAPDCAIAGGFIAYLVAETATFTNCTNSGDVSSKNRLGSFVGYTTTEISLTNCINSGVIALDGMDGRPAGDWVGATSPAAKVTASANTADDADPTAPMLAGTLETIPQGGKQKVRFVALIDSLKYDKVGFKVTSQVDGGTVKDYGSLAVTTAYLSVKAGDNEITASQMNTVLGTNYEYVYALTFKNVPTTGKVVFTAQAYGVVGNETLDDPNIWTITYENGICTGATPASAN